MLHDTDVNRPRRKCTNLNVVCFVEYGFSASRVHNAFELAIQRIQHTRFCAHVHERRRGQRSRSERCEFRGDDYGRKISFVRQSGHGDLLALIELDRCIRIFDENASRRILQEELPIEGIHVGHNTGDFDRRSGANDGPAESADAGNGCDRTFRRKLRQIMREDRCNSRVHEVNSQAVFLEEAEDCNGGARSKITRQLKAATDYTRIIFNEQLVWSPLIENPSTEANRVRADLILASI